MRVPRGLAVWLAVCTVCTAFPGQSQAAAAGIGESGPGVRKEAEPVKQEEVNQAILVEGNGGFRVTVSDYKKRADGTWYQEFAVPGVCGRNGGTYDKKEGDGKTPYGTYSFSMAFGLKENPGSILPYHQIGEDDYWIDDPQSSHYNKLVNAGETTKDWNSGEHMSRQGSCYNYGLVLNYNQDCIPGKGSAIFLHCDTADSDTGSAGCIRIPQEQMKQLIQSVGETTRIVIQGEDRN